MSKQKQPTQAKTVHNHAKVAEEKSNEPAQKVFDITHPGKSMPSASSRPVIVTHRPNIADPMVSSLGQQPKDEEKPETETQSTGEGSEMIMAAPKKNRIEPLHADVVPDDKGTKTPETPAEGDIPEQVVDTASESVPAKSTNDTPDEGNSDSENNEISDMAAEATAKKESQKEASKQAAETAKRQAEVDALINNKQFFVPINAVQKRRSMKAVYALLFFVVMAVTLLAVLDAGLLDIGITPPTDFIQDNR